MSQTVRNNIFIPGERYVGEINGEIFTVKLVKSCSEKEVNGICVSRTEYPVIYFVHKKTGKIIEYGLEAAKRLFLRRIP